jgi:transcription-repair coupling factor (superfamily II helicase)
LKQTDFKEVFKEEIEEDKNFTRECTIDSDAEMLIPDNYVTNINERLVLYTDLDNVEDEEGLKAFEEKLRDRFGPIPKEVKELFDGVRLRKLAKQLGFGKLQQRRGTLKCYTIEDPESAYYDSDVFAKVMGYITKNPARCSMRQLDKNIMIQIKDVYSMHEATEVMKKMMHNAEDIS